MDEFRDVDGPVLCGVSQSRCSEAGIALYPKPDALAVGTRTPVLPPPDLYNQAARSLLGGVAEGQGSIMSTTYYVHARDFAETLSAQLTSAGLHPADMIDVQGFLWGVFSRSRIWFGGHSYGQHKNMLPEFVARSVYATDWGRRPEIAEFFKNVEKLSADDRKARRAELEKAVTEVGARKALTALFDLVGRQGLYSSQRQSYMTIKPRSR